MQTNNFFSFSPQLDPAALMFSLFFSLSISQIIINPNYEVPESDYSNNIMKCRCRYDGHRVWMYSCHNGKTLQPFDVYCLHALVSCAVHSNIYDNRHERQ